MRIFDQTLQYRLRGTTQATPTEQAARREQFFFCACRPIHTQRVHNIHTCKKRGRICHSTMPTSRTASHISNWCGERSCTPDGRPRKHPADCYSGSRRARYEPDEPCVQIEYKKNKRGKKRSTRFDCACHTPTGALRGKCKRILAIPQRKQAASNTP